jgi:hypothetical protein
MRTVWANFGRKIPQLAIHIAALLLLSSAPFCHAYANPACTITAASVTPSTWLAGQTFQITIDGGTFGNECANVLFIQLSTNGGTATVSRPVVVSPTELTATVTLSVDTPAQTATLIVTCLDEVCNEVDTPVQILASMPKNVGDCCDGVGDPINVSSGDVFEHVTDYETAWPEQAELHPLLQ